jgi:chaperone BCS1
VDSAVEESYVAVGYGNHVGWWRGKPVWIRRSLDGGSNTEKFKESLDLVFLGRGSSTVNDFLAGLEKFIRLRAEDKKIYLFANSHGGWTRMATLTERDINTVVVNGNGSHAALDHIRRFESAQYWYRKRGMPHHTGILLEGPPGNGKSSLIHALACATQRNLFYLNLAALENEQNLMQLLGEKRTWSHAILVLEDLDVSGAKVDRTKGSEGSKVTLSTLLNILDGLLSPDGLVVVATTNHPDSLDPALLRAGRFDFRLHLAPLDENGFMTLARVFDIEPETINDVMSNYTPTTGAILRGLFISGEEDLRAHFNVPRRTELDVLID